MATPGIREEKAALRKAMQAVLEGMDETQRQAASRQACERLLRQPIWQQAKAVLGYAPMPQELDIWPGLLQGLATGKTICLPRYRASSRDYEAARIQQPDQEVHCGTFGIREPARLCAAVPLNKLDLILVPGVAFAANGARLGRGQGYYDKWLGAFEGITCGASFDEQVLNTMPTEPHDIYLDCILTPTRWLVAGGGPV